MTELIRCARDLGASDLHLSTGEVPLLRIDGALQRLPAGAALSAAQVESMLQPLFSPALRRAWIGGADVDCAWEAPGLGRLRVHAYRHRRGPGAALRLVASTVRSLEDLGAPPVLGRWALQPRGLVLCTGPTGSGKSTLLAAMVRHRLALRADHVLTLEDPIEFIHEGQRGLITQREVGRQAEGFATALRSALRQDPDVILVGELRDPDSIRLALTAAETGHLVLGTLHASSAHQAVDRLVDAFPAQEKELARAMLAESLLGVVAQVLCRRRDGAADAAPAAGRIAALEILSATPAVRHLIREHKVAQLVSVMQSGHAHGMQTLDQHLAVLVRERLISREEAQLHAHHPETLT